MVFFDRIGTAGLGVGVYTLPQMAKLVRLPLSVTESLVSANPDEIVTPRWTPIAYVDDDGSGEPLATFLDLMELFVASRLRASGLSWPTIRLATFEARKELNERYPLSSGTFRTDRKRLFIVLRKRVEDQKEPSKSLLDLVQRQGVFEEVVEQTLSPEIVVRDDHGQLSAWYPIGKHRRVILDPRRRFGSPIDPVSGTPTSALAAAAHAEGSTAEAAELFGVDEAAVVDALAFEKWLHER